ncbi:hypothetical protein SAMN05444410_112112 [Hydrobacter penzbergensis]|uniref:Pyrroline-5-carboxylate reductase catalytic N-terminal domain-containing protein n=1 Tax=Hydrobacter penzbergensis TaxID=1235997 RepID=A0A8X8IIQ4_9BACT|nr:NAD(P)-binding domain-containing protein [Hydrobacter penzbergensis]SDX29218.1 hypothetical protein SAMN05444410_112112 [Hydrobacter penzbergensis]
MKKTVVIIGVNGKTRTALANELAKAGYRLLVAGSDPTQYSRLYRYIKTNIPEAEIEEVACEKEACWEADMIVLAISRNAFPELVEKVKEVSTQKTVLCLSDDKTGNYFPFSEAQEIQQLLPFSKVVAAFNNGLSTEMLIAGDDKESVQQVAAIVEAAGYEPIVAECLSTIKTL